MFLLAFLAAHAQDSAPASAEGGSTLVNWTEAEVKVKARVTLSDFPPEAEHLPREELGCVVRIFIDTDGVPTHTEARACNPVLYPSASAIAMRYRFYPVRSHGTAVDAAFDLRANFAATGGGPTDIRTGRPEDLAKIDERTGYAPVDPKGLPTRHEAPRRLLDVPRGAVDHPVPDRLCRLHVRVEENGRVSSTDVVRCAADLSSEASRLLKAWKFARPARSVGHSAVSFDALVDYKGVVATVTFAPADAGNGEPPG